MRVEWTPERIIRLKELWNEGHSGQAIANIMALGCTRSAILGKINSLGLTRKVSKRKPKSKPLPVFTPPPVIAQKITVDTRKKFINLKRSDCRYPIGDPYSIDFVFCGSQTDGIHSFCKHHMEVCYVKSTRKR